MKFANTPRFLILNFVLSMSVGVGAYYIISKASANNATQLTTGSADLPNTIKCTPKRINNNSYKFTKPIILLESDCEASTGNLLTIKSQISSSINNYVNQGVISKASFYLKDMNETEWIGVNNETGFSPGSLLKVPLAITIMKQVEMKKLSLDQTITATPALKKGIHQTYSNIEIEMGKTYTVRELMKFMLAHSDNYATNLLHQVADKNLYGHIFDELKIAKPLYGQLYLITPKSFSVFMRVLYNGTYIGRKNSDMILQMMSESSFKIGMKSVLEGSTYLSSKFGETKIQDMFQLHEAGIIYVKGGAYMMTIMTEGKEIEKLPTVISGLSKIAYDVINSNAKVANAY